MDESGHHTRLKKLQGHPPGTVLAYERFLEKRDPQHLDTLVLEIIRYNHPDPQTLRLEQLQPESRLNQDMGMDSVAMIETVFLLEDLLGIEVPNADLEPIQTLGDLRAYLNRRIADLPDSLPGT